MPSRRDVLEAAVVLAALPALGAARPAPGWRGDVLVDERFAASRAFGAAAAGEGRRVHAGGADWSFLWSSHLQRAWTAEPTPLAAITPHGPWFTFQQLARPRGLRMVFTAELGRGRLRVTGPRAAVDAALLTAQLDPERWGTHLAQIIGALSGVGRAAEGEVACDTGDEPLYAWLLAPSPRAPRFVS